MRKDPLRDKSMAFAVRIVKMCRWIRDEQREYAIADQVLRSGTSIGANLSEAMYAASDRDFLSKNKIALKECSETMFWLDLIEKAEIAPAAKIANIKTDCDELRKMLSSACKTLEERLA